jgi:hypothetical protein
VPLLAVKDAFFACPFDDEGPAIGASAGEMLKETVESSSLSVSFMVVASKVESSDAVSKLRSMALREEDLDASVLALKLSSRGRLLGRTVISAAWRQ